MMRPFAALALAALFALPAAARPGAGWQEPPEPTAEQRAVHQLRRQIAAEELAFALNLDPEQKAVLSEFIRDQLLRREAMQTRGQELAERARPLLEHYLAEVRAEGRASDATVARLMAVQEQHRALRQEEERGDLRRALRDLLDEAQLETLRGFRPMAELAPPPEARERRRSERRGSPGQGEGDPRIDEETREELRTADEQRQRGRQVRRLVRHVLLSEAMLEVLNR